MRDTFSLAYRRNQTRRDQIHETFESINLTGRLKSPIHPISGFLSFALTSVRHVFSFTLRRPFIRSFTKKTTWFRLSIARPKTKPNQTAKSRTASIDIPRYRSISAKKDDADDILRTLPSAEYRRAIKDNRF